VAPLRSPFASAIGLPGERPDLVVRFCPGPALPPSLRRPLDAVRRRNAVLPDDLAQANLVDELGRPARGETP
jgi:hypothetical protein